MQSISQKLIGLRVQSARKAANLKQDELSEKLGFNDRQILSSIENGSRNLKSSELLQLADILARDLEFFIDPFAVAGEAKFSWRAAPELPEDNLNNFELTAGKWIGLLRWLREQQSSQVSVLKRALRISDQSSYEDAQACAESLVDELELGVIPAETLIEKIERDLDIPVLFVDALQTADGKAISGATCHLDNMAAILINRNESEARRYFDLAHELFHALTWDTMQPEHRESNAVEVRSNSRITRIEQLADNFAAALLMPRKALEKLIDLTKKNDTAHLLQVAALLRVSPTALAWRLFNLKLIPLETKQTLVQEKRRASVAETPKRFSINFVTLLHESIDKGRLSAKKAAKTMGMSLPGLLELFDQHNLSAPYEL